jgi:F-type H+-transporting ATPase subunit alpha
VGGNAQVKAMKKIASTLRLDLAAFREQQAFAQLGTDLDAATQKQLDRGYRMVELLKQPQYKPYPVQEQIISIFAAGHGYIDDVAVADVLEFETKLHEYFRTTNPELLQEIREKGEMTDELADKVKAAIEAFKG